MNGLPQQIFIDGRFLSVDAAFISAISAGALFGKGVFTTVRIYNGGATLWDKHWKRLASHASQLGIDLSDHTAAAVEKDLNEVIVRAGISGGRARLTIFDSSSSPFWPYPVSASTSLVITAAPHRPFAAPQLGLSRCNINSTSPLAGIKSCNYLEQVMALDEAKGRGYDEAIRLNERGEVASACMANVFWLMDGALYTPSLETGCLAGTTREVVLESLKCSEVEAGASALAYAEAIFLTSAGLGVVRVAAIDGRTLAGSDHPILDLIPA